MEYRLLKKNGEDMSKYIEQELTDQLVAVAEKELAELTEKKMASPNKYEYFGWPEGVLMLGLLEAERFDALEKHIDGFIKAGKKFSRPDNGLAGYPIIRLYEETGDEKYKKLADSLATILFNYPRDMNDSIVYGEGIENWYIYSDGTGMATIFLSHYARVFGDHEAEFLARKQLLNFFNYGIDPETGLPYHGYDVQNGYKFPNLGWGRGAGWLMIGTAGYLCNWKNDELEEKADRMIKAIFGCAMENGMFSWNLPTLEGPADTSATGMIMSSAYKMKQKGLLKDISLDVFKKAADASRAYIENGVVSGSSGSCLDFGNYSKTYEHNVWGQGAILDLYSILEK